MAAANGHYLVYADGACIGNPGPGGWGVVIVEPDGRERELNGAAAHTTNNKMELTAAIEGLRHVESGARVVLRSDSQYVINTMKLGWKRNKNRDLWEQLDLEAQLRDVAFEWVRGHADDPLNNRADELANMGARGEIAGAPRGNASAGAMARAGSAGAAARKLEAILGPGESIRRCAGCGREFVSSPASDSYCSLAECQLIARR